MELCIFIKVFKHFNYIFFYSMSICIFASELAIITGHNKYQNLNVYILKLWQKTFPYDYQEHLDLYSNKNNVEIV